jgi:hypothetical protein
LSGDNGQADDRVFVDPDESCGLTHPTTLLEVLEDADGFLFREFAMEQGCAFAFGEALLTGAASQKATLLLRAIAEADAQVLRPPSAIVFAFGVLAAEVFQVVHGSFIQSRAREKLATGWKYPI